MNANEFETHFDVLYNNITSNQAPGLNPFEKSVLLTKAQNEIVKNYFTSESKGNTLQSGFDETNKRQIDFSMLIKTIRVDTLASGTPYTTIDNRAITYLWPADTLYIINEAFNAGTHAMDKTKPRQIIAITYSDYTRLMSKPYKAPLKYEAWRLITGQSEQKRAIVEIILNAPDFKVVTNDSIPSPEYGENRYVLRYVRKPRPILLANFDGAYGEDLSIEGLNGGGDYDLNNPCELHESIHWEILQRAVELAKAAWATNQESIASSQMTQAIGERSE